MEKRSKADLHARKKPSNAVELAELSEWYFGKSLHLQYLKVIGETASYRVSEKYNEYHGKSWLHDTHCIKGYDYSRDFWQWAIGELYCGGIAAHSYGQTWHSKSETDRLKVLAGTT